jgi:hypothetical protein
MISFHSASGEPTKSRGLNRLPLSAISQPFLQILWPTFAFFCGGSWLIGGKLRIVACDFAGCTSSNVYPIVLVFPVKTAFTGRRQTAKISSVNFFERNALMAMGFGPKDAFLRHARI